jgi:hypothetical protein
MGDYVWRAYCASRTRFVNETALIVARRLYSILMTTTGRGREAMRTSSEFRKGDRVKFTGEGTVGYVSQYGAGIRVDLIDGGSVSFNDTGAGAILDKVIPDEPPLGSLVEIGGKVWARAGRGASDWSEIIKDGEMFWGKLFTSWDKIYRPGFKVLN